MKLHNILIGIIIIGLIITGITIFISDSATHYKSESFNESELKMYDGMNEINSIMEEYSEEEGFVDPDSSIIDKLGSLFASSYQSARILKKSTGVMKDMTEDSVGNNEILGGYGRVLANGIITIIGIVILVGIFLHIVTKSDRT